MNEQNKLQGMMGTTMEKIREMVDVNTIIGEPIQCPDGTTVIPISKVSYGFAAGGSDLPAKVDKDLFGGGSGAGITINPVGFLVISNGDVKLLQMSINASTPNAIVNLVPEVMEKIGSFLGKEKKPGEKETLE